MQASDLDHRELLEYDPAEGVIRFAGQRALLLDAGALGLLRREIIDTVGMIAARGILTHFGYAHGWRTAEGLRHEFPWDSEREWRIAGGRLHALQGLVRFEPVIRDPSDDTPAPFAESLWRDSYEAEQHLAHLGVSDEPVCWTLCGFASGYLSCSNGREIFCIEDRCVGRGDAVCHMVGRTREEWGDAIEAHLPFFQHRCPDSRLADVTDALKRTERRLRQRQKELQRQDGDAADPSGIIARSQGMKRVLELGRRVAKVDSTVLVTGESGVGKERVARLIHDESGRSAAPFVALNCAAVSESLIESELFGHARGSFTGAAQDRPGLFEAASGGTLFLDEIGEIPVGLQAKLLRALQEKEVRRVGENKNRPVDVRLVAATHRDLSAEIAAKRFRQDLYYRLRVIELRIPPLRERRDDILPLTHALLAEASRRMGRRMTGLTPQAADQLLRYEWPGNVRELQNAVERAVVLSSSSRVEVEDLPEEVRTALPSVFNPGPVRPLDEVEREYILAVLAQNGGNQAKTAAQLRIGTATLYRKLKQYRHETLHREAS